MIFCFCILLLTTFLHAKEVDDFLTGSCTEDAVLTYLVPLSEWKPFPPARERSAWEALKKHPLHREREKYLTEAAEALLGNPWPALPAALYMEFVRTGNRSRYQAPYFARREQLSTLVFAECMEHKGRFLDEIANGIWAVCEESSWCLPAHASRLKGDVLHRPDRESLDLFACETGMSLAQIHYLLREELDALSPALCLRIEREVKRRIIDPYAAGDDFSCSGWINGYNNWSPWCASNVMGAAMYLEKDPKRLAGMVYRLMEVVDRFINRYGDDGGCDEGPSYWNEAGGALLVFLEMLHSRTNGALSIYDQPKIAAMGRFILHAHIAGKWFANFADADPCSRPHPGKVFRFGERVECGGLKNMALLSMRNWDANGPIDPPIRISGVSRSVLGPLMELFWIPPEAKPEPLSQKLHVWLPDLQVLFARESQTPQKGLVLAAKGGHNAESHNHNDIGHFILFLDGQPGIIDVGRESYTRQTFSSRRYELWFTRGAGHNAPVVNGVEQHPGRRYKATGVQCNQAGGDSVFSLQLEKAYPAKAELTSLRRTFAFHRGSDANLAVVDAYQSKKESTVVRVRLYTPQQVKQTKPGRLALMCSPRPLLLDYNPDELTAAVKTVPVEDRLMRRSWGGTLRCIDLTTKKGTKAGRYTFICRPAR